jgi:anti-anti-sigma regulatory factor
MLNVHPEALAAEADAGLRLRLEGVLTIATVGQAHAPLLNALAAWPAGPVLLDTQAVSEADSAGAQLLLALSHQLARDGRPAWALPPSPALARVACALGLGDGSYIQGYASPSVGAAA